MFYGDGSRSCAFAASQSASISARVESCGRWPFAVKARSAGEIDHGEQQIANLDRRLGAIAIGDFGFNLVAFLADFRDHRHRIVPIEAYFSRLGLELESASHGG